MRVRSRRRWLAVATAAWIVGALSACGTAVDQTATAGQAGAITYEDFRKTVRPLRDGSFLVGGDLVVHSETLLRAFHRKHYSGGQALVIGKRGSRDDKWARDVHDISYCVQPNAWDVSTKRPLYNKVRHELKLAADAWAGLIDVRFREVGFESESGGGGKVIQQCSKNHKPIADFVVLDLPPKLFGDDKPDHASRFSSFQPSAPFPSGYKIRLSQLTVEESPRLRALLMHALGHALGFVDEGVQAGTLDNCYETRLPQGPNGHRSLSSYDPASIMANPKCWKSRRGNEFSPKDQRAAQEIYGVGYRGAVGNPNPFGGANYCDDARCSNYRCKRASRGEGSDRKGYLFCDKKTRRVARGDGDAQEVCSGLGMTLARIDNASENRWIVDTHRKLHDTSDDEGVWIGAQDSFSEGAWKWEDGATFFTQRPGERGNVVPGFYANWVSGEPNDDGSGEDCGELIIDPNDSRYLRWNDDGCREKQAFVCKRKGQPVCAEYSQAPGVIPAAFRRQPCFVFDCDIAASKETQQTYLACQRKVDWTTARFVCWSQSMHLATIDSEGEGRWISSLVKGKMGKGGAWLGMRRDSGGNFVTSTGKKVSEFPFAERSWCKAQPSGGNQRCVALENGPNQFPSHHCWNDQPCAADDAGGVVHGFVCERPRNK